MRVRFAYRAVLVILLIPHYVACIGKESPSVADPNRYLNAVIEFADNVLKYGRDTYGPKHTPLFVDGLNVNTHEPVKWIAPNGDRWILSNLASQQNLLRTLDGLTRITGDPKYKQAAMDAIKYAFENLRSPNGLLYWGGHAVYDAGADRPIGRNIHEFKCHYPYYELMWEVNPQATKQFIEAFWSTTILNWSNLDMNRHSSIDSPVVRAWKHVYKGGPVPFESQGLAFQVTASDLIYAAALLSKFTGEKEPLEWAKHLAYRYVETRNSKTNVSIPMFTVTPGVQMVNVFPHQAYSNRQLRKFEEGYSMGTPGTFINKITAPWLCQLILGQILGEDGKEFIQWVDEELVAWGKVSYNQKDNAFVPILLSDGTSMEGYVCRENDPLGFKGSRLESVRAETTEFWAYVLAYCLTEDDYMWEMTRSIALGNDCGDLGVRVTAEPRLNLQTDSLDPYMIVPLLELYHKTGERAYLAMARRIGENILVHRFHKGFFLPDNLHTFAKFDSIDPLVLLHLYKALNGSDTTMPKVLPSTSFFDMPYRQKDQSADNQLIYTLAGLSEPPESLQEAAAKGNMEVVRMLIAKGEGIDGVEDSIYRTPLHRAIERRHTDIVEFLLTNGANANVKGDWRFETPLHYAAERGFKEIIDLLLRKGADVNATNSYGDKPLQYAAFSNRKDIIELLLQKGATIANLHIAAYMGDLAKIEAFIQGGKDINVLDGHGYAPLHYAAQNGRKQALELLIARGADVNAKDWNGQTPLFCAIVAGNKDMIEFLISKGADINVKNNNGQTLRDFATSQNREDIVDLLIRKGATEVSIHTAVRRGDVDEVRSCLDKGADVNARDNNGFTPLHLVTNKDVAELFIAKGADVNAKDPRGYTPFHYALFSSRIDIAKLLVVKGVDLNAKDNFGFTPLHRAVTMGNQELSEFILAQGVDVNIRDKDGWTPLHQAACNGIKELSELLINKGADVNAKSNSSETPLDTAILKNANPVIDLLIAKGALASTLNVAAYRGDLDKIKSALKDGVDVNSKNSEGETLLCSAALEGHKDIVEFLLSQGADVNIKNSQDRTALHAAATGGHKDTVDLLIAKGADINAVGVVKHTPLYIAVRNKHKEVVELLLEKGANLDIEDLRGQTPLQIAEKAGSTEIVDLLRKHGAKE